MIYFSEAIVLKNYAYGEADSIVTYFTKDFGLINLFAKSPRKIKSKFGSSLEPLTYSRISFIGREDKLQKIIQSDIIEPFQIIRENYRLFLKISEVLRLLLQFLPKREPNNELFYLFLDTLFYLKEKNNHDSHIIFLKLKLLSLLGYLPDFKNCGLCRDRLNGDIYYSQGFVICKNCFLNILPSNDTAIKSLSRGLVKILNEMSTWKLKYLERVKLSLRLLIEIENFLSYHLSNTIKL